MPCYYYMYKETIKENKMNTIFIKITFSNGAEDVLLPWKYNLWEAQAYVDELNRISDYYSKDYAYSAIAKEK